ncbi:MAG: hydrogenase nickel incorporation protein HypB [Oscillospiraceae bacterium]|nr:hydrogenase nickel incorporation protein HypB [Oscillospiraceae bacterium]
MDTKDIKIMADINEEIGKIAAGTREKLRGKGVLAVNVIGAPGAGKTSCLLHIIEGLKGVRCYVIEGDIQSNIDTDRLKALGIEAVQINTGGECHLDSVQIQNTVNEMPLDGSGILFIENIGNLVCPAESNIGESLKMLIVTVTEGADKPYKYPLAFEKAGIIILNKADLLPYVDFDMDYFMRGVRALNADAPVFEVSAKNGAGFDGVCECLARVL